MNHGDVVKQSSDALHHEAAEELLEDYALGTLSDADRARMDAHVESCPICKEELAPLMNAVQALAFAAPEPGVEMSDETWNRIAKGISRADIGMSDPTFVPLHDEPIVWNLPPAGSQPTRMTPRQWLLVAALMLLSLIGGTILGQVLPQLGDEESDVQQIAIQFTDPSITATGELRYLPDEGIFLLSVNDMPAAPEGYVYQAWLIQGDAKIPAGVMNTEQGEIASVGDRSQFDTFAITVEPGPLGTETPTSEPILVAPLHGNDEG